MGQRACGWCVFLLVRHHASVYGSERWLETGGVNVTCHGVILAQVHTNEAVSCGALWWFSLLLP